MLTILPLQDGEEKSALLRQRPEAGADAEVLVMKDRGETLGWTAVDVRDSCVRMLRVRGADGSLPAGPEGRFLADSLMRAAASFGANHGAYRIFCLDPEAGPLLEVSGFRREGRAFAQDLGEIVHVTKGPGG